MVGQPAQSNRMCYKHAKSNNMSIIGEGIGQLENGITLHIQVQF